MERLIKIIESEIAACDEYFAIGGSLDYENRLRRTILRWVLSHAKDSLNMEQE